MTYDEAKRKRIAIEAQHHEEMWSIAGRESTPRLLELNKQLTQAIFEEARASRDDSRVSDG